MGWMWIIIMGPETTYAMRNISDAFILVYSGSTPMDRISYCSNGINNNLGYPVSRAYIDEFFPLLAKAEVRVSQHKETTGGCCMTYVVDGKFNLEIATTLLHSHWCNPFVNGLRLIVELCWFSSGWCCRVQPCPSSICSRVVHAL